MCGRWREKEGSGISYCDNVIDYDLLLEIVIVIEHPSIHFFLKVKSRSDLWFVPLKFIRRTYNTVFPIKWFLRRCEFPSWNENTQKEMVIDITGSSVEYKPTSALTVLLDWHWNWSLAVEMSNPEKIGLCLCHFVRFFQKAHSISFWFTQVFAPSVASLLSLMWAASKQHHGLVCGNLCFRPPKSNKWLFFT